VNDPFATLGLARRYDLDLSELERRYRDLQRALHPDRHTTKPASERRMTLQKAVEVNEAYRILRDDQRRAEALLAALGGETRAEPDRAADPELLMEMMELREALSEAKAAGDTAGVARLAERVTRERAETREKLLRSFAALPEKPVASALGPARELVSRLKYYQRFLDEVAVFEDEARS
jgi:molecular chaperone HscB